MPIVLPPQLDIPKPAIIRAWSRDDVCRAMTAGVFVRKKRASLTEVLVDRTTGTNIGDMTSNGGLAASWNGDTTETAGSASAKGVATDAYVGKTFAVAKIVSRIKIYGTTNAGFIDGGGAVSTTLHIMAKNGAAPSGPTDGASLGSVTFTNTTNESAGRDIASTDQATAYLHIWARISTAAGNAKRMAEIELWELV